MKIIVLHGDHTEKSYERLQKFIAEAKKRKWEIRKLSGKSSDPISEQLANTSLFSEPLFVVLEDPARTRKNDIEWISENADSIDATLIIYHRGTLRKTLLKNFPIEKTEEYKLPKLIWNLLDSFFPGNGKNFLVLLHEVIKNEAIEFVFSLLAKQVRDMHWVKHDPDTIPYPSWRVGKLKRQAMRFPDGLLKEIILDLAEIDIKVKTSKDKLIDLLDFLVISKLE